MKNKRLAILFTLVILLITSISFADNNFDIPNPTYEYYVYDGAEIMSSRTENYILDINHRINQETGAQIVIASVPSLNGEEIKFYANKIFEGWEIGKKGQDNGILVLIAPNENKIWIEVGYGLEGALPDSIVKRIIEDEIIPSFKIGDYDNGIVLGFNRIIQGIEAEYGISLEDVKLEARPSEDRSMNPIPTIIIMVAVLIIDAKFFKGAIFYTLTRSIGMNRRGGGYYDNGRGDNYYGGPSGRYYGTFHGSGKGGSSRGGGGRSGGGGAGGNW